MFESGVSTEVHRDTWALMKDQATVLVKSRFLPSSVDTPEKAIAIMLKGRELGIPPMQSFAQISVIQGKPAAGSELQLALIYRNCPGAKVEYLERTDTRCVIEASRPGQRPQRFTYSIEDAQKAGLTGKDNWRKFPRIMLSWRCVSEMARSVFPDAIMGMSHTPEELNPDIAIDAEGRVETIPEIIEADEPEADVVEKFDYNIETHRSLAREAAKKHGHTVVDDIKTLYLALSGRPLNELEAFVSTWKPA